MNNWIANFDEMIILFQIEFRTNIPFEELLKLIEESSIGLHTMVNEHFGIVVVECLASALITIAHDSAGPKMDIIEPGVSGYLASDAHEFADALINVTRLSKEQVNKMRLNARQSVDRFGEQEFESSFLSCIENII